MHPIKKIIGSMLVAAVLSQVIFVIFSYGLNKYDVHKTTRLTEILERKTDYNIVYLGSSRVHSDIYPKIVDSITSLTSYNLGIEGGNILEFKTVLDAYLINHPAPGWMVLSIDFRSFNLSRRVYNYTQYFPYVNNAAIKRLLTDEDQYVSLFGMARFLELTAVDDKSKVNSLKGLMGHTEIHAGDFQYNGYLSNTEASIQKEKMVFETSGNKIDPAAIGMLQAMIDTCKQHNVKLMFVCLPNYNQLFNKKGSHYAEAIQVVDSLAKQNGYPFWRHDSLEISSNATLFANVGHLNKPGSFVYSTILGNEIQQYIRRGD